MPTLTSGTSASWDMVLEAARRASEGRRSCRFLPYVLELSSSSSLRPLSLSSSTQGRPSAGRRECGATPGSSTGLGFVLDSPPLGEGLTLRVPAGPCLAAAWLGLEVSTLFRDDRPRPPRGTTGMFMSDSPLDIISLFRASAACCS